jgi:hypothetical protein
MGFGALETKKRWHNNLPLLALKNPENDPFGVDLIIIAIYFLATML